jgi:uncharacterized RDD family membrane protein YckC
MPAQYCGNCGEALATQEKVWAQKELRGLEPLKPRVPPVRRDSKPTVPVAVDHSPRAVPPQSPARRPATGAAKQREAPAGFWIRLVAYLIDYVIVFLPMMVAGVASTLLLVPAIESPQGGGFSPLAVLLFSAGGILTLLLSILYPLYFWVSRGATPGKMLLNLRIVTEEGQSPIDTKQALLRLVGYFVNSFTLGIGFLLIAFSTDKRGLHDRLAETSVVRRRA